MLDEIYALAQREKFLFLFRAIIMNGDKIFQALKRQKSKIS